MSDLKAFIRETMPALETAPDEKKAQILKQISSLLERTFENLSSFSDIPEYFFETIQPNVERQVRAVEIRTERAADAVMTSCEKISASLKDVPPESKKAIQQQINKVFEACNFQDLVAQHANEVRLLMKELGDDIGDMKAFLASDGYEIPKVRTKDKNRRPDAHLLNGPAMPEEMQDKKQA
jgi:chemotaxis regulatin CheY-phosphate phosphatase CheZ